MPSLGGGLPWVAWEAARHAEFPPCFRLKVTTLIVCAVMCDDEGGVSSMAQVLGEVIEALSGVMSETVSFESPRGGRKIAAPPPPRAKAERPTKPVDDPRGSSRGSSRKVKQGSRLILDAGGHCGDTESEYPNPFAMPEGESATLASSMGRSGLGKSRTGRMEIAGKTGSKGRHTSRRAVEEEKKPRGQKSLAARNPPLAHEMDRSAKLDAIHAADPLSFVRNMHAGTKSMLNRDRGVR